MKHEFKQGFRIGGEGGTAVTYQLVILVENINCLPVYRLSQAVGREFQQILSEQYGAEKGGLDGWEIHHFD